jgi:hypothetical protein
MRKSASYALALLIAAGAPASSEAAGVMRAKDFADHIGVNVHVAYTDSDYRDPGAVLGALRYLGVSHVRDGTLRSGMQGQARTAFQQLFAAGIGFDFFVQGDITDALGNLRAVAEAFPTAIDAIEGPNEINNFPVSYDGKTGHVGAQAYQAALYAAVKADPVLGKLPVYNFTDWPETAGRADYVNVHPYAKNGDQPRGWIAGGIAAYAPLMPGFAPVMTEGGYYTLPGYGWGGVDEATQAKLMVNFFLDGVDLGAARIFSYQLLDAYADKTGSDQEKHFGLFDVQYKPKPAATALRTLLMLIHDNGVTAQTFTPEPLGYKLDGLPATAHSLVLQKSDGWRFILLWNEPDIWDEKQNQPIAVSPKAVILRLTARHAVVTVNDVTAGAQSIATLTQTDQVPLQLADVPLVIAVSPK